MPTRVEKTKFYNPATGHHEETDIPGTKNELMARGYVPEGHDLYEAPAEAPAAKPEPTRSALKPSGESAGK